MYSIGVLSKVIGFVTMIQGYGTLHYGNSWIRVDVDNEIIRYYRSLIPKYYYVKPPKHNAHITVVRFGKEKVAATIKNQTLWGKYEKELVDFEYLPLICQNGKYFYLNIHSKRIGEIRQELGLPIFRDSFSCYHLTIGNIK